MNFSERASIHRKLDLPTLHLLPLLPVAKQQVPQGEFSLYSARESSVQGLPIMLSG